MFFFSYMFTYVTSLQHVPSTIIVDFEFTNLGRDLILLSGAMSYSLTIFDIVKLEGKPLLLKADGSPSRIATPKELGLGVTHLVKIFEQKPDKLVTTLAQIFDSVVTTKPNLDARTMKDYFLDGGNNATIVLWCGDTDKTILTRLGFNLRVQHLRAYDVENTGRFYLELLREDKTVIHTVHIGKYEKTGRLLSLQETHDSLCKQPHTIEHAHDPRTDVLWTKCLFNIVTQDIGLCQLF